MSLPKWDTRWDPPDPLRGRSGWTRRHYTNLVVASTLVGLLLACAIPGVVIPAVVRAKKRQAILEKQNKLHQESFEEETDTAARVETP